MPSEHAHQAALMAWASSSLDSYPELALLLAIPNAGKRGPMAARKMVAEGLRAGVPDLCLPVARGPWHGLWIELKKPGGRVQPNQRQWLAALAGQGYRAEVCYGLQEARELLVEYLDTKK